MVRLSACYGGVNTVLGLGDDPSPLFRHYVGPMAGAYSSITQR
jgi:hypothetical protein